MNYDRKELEDWVKMETWDQFLERHEAFTGISTEQFKAIKQRYFEEVKKRANYCTIFCDNKEGT